MIFISYLFPAISFGLLSLFRGELISTNNVVSFQKDELDILSGPDPFVDLHGVIVQYQGDNNVVMLQAGKPGWASGHTLNQGCGSP